MTPFADFAPSYWAAQLPVIPLRAKSKAPLPSKWQLFASQMPDENTRQYWLENFPDSNLGLPLGPQSRMVAIDVDTENVGYLKAIAAVLPHTPWVRKGKKGAVFMYRIQDHRTFRIRTVQGENVVECLAKGTQVVLPGSIHPDTGMPYTANANLWDLIHNLPPLPRDIETLLREALVEAGATLSSKGNTKITEFVSAGSRDNAMTSHAGILARAVTRGERTLAEALSEMDFWCANYVEKVVGDELDPAKARNKIIEFIKRDIYEGARALPKGWDEGLQPSEHQQAVTEFGDNEEWDFERLQTYINDQFSIHDRNSPGRRKAIEHVLFKLSKSTTLTTVDSDSIIQYLVATSGRSVSTAALRTRLKELKTGEVEGTDHTEIARLLLTELERFGQIRFFGDKFWQWAGAHWSAIPEHRILETLATEFGGMSAARKYSDHKGILKVMANLVPRGLGETSVNGINFANGYLTADLQLKDHDPKFGCTYVLPYCYEPEKGGLCLRFLGFLDQCWGNDEDYADKVEALREAIAVTMFGIAPRYQKAFCLMGVAHSGKSVLKDMIFGLMPEGTMSSVPPQDWADRFLPTEMFGKLANFCGELSERDLIPGDKFKSIVDGDEMNGQFKNRDIFRFKPTCAHWFASNHIPRTRDSSSGFSRRWLFLKFNKVVPERDRIVGLAWDILSEERAAIVAWAVQALPRVVRNNGFTIPPSCKREVREMAALNNSVRFFLQDGGVQVSSPTSNGSSTLNRTMETDLHNAYWSFCRATAGVQPVSLKIFRLRMMEMAGEFGFELKTQLMPNGAESSWYENVTLAGPKVGRG